MQRTEIEELHKHLNKKGMSIKEKKMGKICKEVAIEDISSFTDPLMYKLLINRGCLH